MEGTCLCGAITVKITDNEIVTKGKSILCHCENCKKTSGGIFAVNILMENSKFSITGEENLKVYSDHSTTSGAPVHRSFCSTCGTPIKSTSPRFEGTMTALKLGIFPKIPAPMVELFVVNREDWEKPFEGCVEYQKGTVSVGGLK